MELTQEHIRLIREKVEEAGTLKAFADEIGVYPQTVGRWISGEAKEVKGKNIKKLISALGIRPSMQYPVGIAHYSVAQDRSGLAQSSCNWFSFADWASKQPQNVQKAIIGVAESHGYNS